MKANALVSNYTVAQYKILSKGCNESKTSNVVGRKFDDRDKLEVAVSDLTYVRVGSNWNYVCTLVDLSNREVIGYSAGPNKDASLVEKALLSCRYSLKDIKIDNILETFEIERSLIRKGNPYDNAVSEAMNKVLKVEFIYQNKFESLDELAKQANELDIEASKRDLSRIEQIIGSEDAIDTLVKDIIQHYENNRAELITGKAMIVAYNRRIAVDIYNKILELRPDWNEKVNVVVTANNNDPEEWKEIIGSNNDKDELARRFKDNNDPFKIAIVVDMWLTGFDVPSLHTMYVYKPMKGHNLMQAIARVNRVFKDKEGGLVVDYIGIASELKEAMSDYTQADKKTMDNADIRDSAYPVFEEKLKLCRDVFFNNFNVDRILRENISSEELGDLVIEGLNLVLTYHENKENDFRNEAYVLKQAHTLCSSMTNEAEQREAAFYEAIRNSMSRIKGAGKLSKNEINEQIGKLLEQSIHSEGVINLFKDFEKGFSLFDPLFIEKIERMEQKNLSVELLEKLLKDEITAYSTGDIVKGGEFSERLKRIMNSYRDGQIANAEALDLFTNIAEDTPDYDKEGNVTKTREALLKLAKDIMNLSEENEKLGLSKEELAFYHAISKPENIEDFYTDEELINFTKELTELIASEMTPDWSVRESGLAHMRSKVKRFLEKHKYPRNEMGNIIELIVDQAEEYGEIANI